MNQERTASMQRVKNEITSMVQEIETVDLLKWTNEAMYLLGEQKTKISEEAHREGIWFVYQIVCSWIIRLMPIATPQERAIELGRGCIKPFDSVQEAKDGMAAIMIANAYQFSKYTICSDEVEAFSPIATKLMLILDKMEMYETYCIEELKEKQAA